MAPGKRTIDDASCRWGSPRRVSKGTESGRRGAFQAPRTACAQVACSGGDEAGVSEPSGDWAMFGQSWRASRARGKGGGTSLPSAWDSPSDQASGAGTCLPSDFPGQGWPPPSDQLSPLYPLPPCTGCQAGPSHSLAALLCPHPPSQGSRPARHHPASPEPHLGAGGHLPGPLHTLGQVPGPTLHPPPGGEQGPTPSSSLLPAPSQRPTGTPTGLGAGREPAYLFASCTPPEAGSGGPLPTIPCHIGHPGPASVTCRLVDPRRA